MVTIKREGIILECTDLNFESESVMNPAVIAEENTVHMLYRAVREGNYSTIGYCRLEGPLKVVQRNKEPLISPEFDYESQGVEDPRIVKIGDLDSNACCGVHPKSTLDLRLIKIKRWEKNRGNTRIEFFAGKRAIDYILKRDLILNDICKYLKSGEEEVIKGIANINDKVQEISNENKKLEAIVSDYEIKDMINKSTKINNISIIKNIYTDKSMKYISKVASKITENDNFIALLALINDDKANLVYASSKNLDVKVNDLLKDSIKLIDGNGGGTPFMAQGGGKNNGNIENTLNYALSKLEKSIG